MNQLPPPAGGAGQVLLAALALVLVAMVTGPSAGLQGSGIGPGGTGPATGQDTPSLQVPYGATSDSNGHMIAVTGVDRTGASVLYLVDTEREQLAVYQATAGSSSMEGVKLIGARRLDLDLQLFGYNDRSEYTYRELRDQFDELADQ